MSNVWSFEAARACRMAEAQPQVEHGYTRIANELLEAIARFGFNKREYKIVLAIIRKTYGYRKKSDAVSMWQLAKLTCVPRTHVANTVRQLLDRQVLIGAHSERTSHGQDLMQLGLNKRYEQWLHRNQNSDRNRNSDRNCFGCTTVTVLERRPYPIRSTTKERSTKEITKEKISPPDGGEGESKIPACPHREIINLYHQILPMGRRVLVDNTHRRRKLQARWRENRKHQSLAFWQTLFEHTRESRFLTGRAKPAAEKPPFQISLDFIVTPNKFADIIEGRYHDPEP